jgi:cobalt/nickel transport system permease protein
MVSSIDGAVLDLKRLDRLADGDTALHRLDPRAKVLVTVVFIVAVVSYDRYELAALFPFFIFPAVMVGLGNLPVGYIVRKIAIVIPVALVVGMFNPLFDRQVLVHLGPLGISGGWVSYASLLVRAMLTGGGALILLGLTGFSAICQALERLGMPRVFAVQLLFLYRYLFVLTEEGARASRARELRSLGQRGRGIASYGSLVGHLLLRTWQRAERIHMAMLARGFTGEFRTQQLSGFGRVELLFLACWVALFITLRLLNVSRLLGEFITGMLP